MKKAQASERIIKWEKAYRGKKENATREGPHQTKLVTDINDTQDLCETFQLTDTEQNGQRSNLE